MRLIDADKDPCKECMSRPFCSGMCVERRKWYNTTIDPVKHGHWVEDDGGRLFNDHYCSLCNHYALRDGLGFECLTDWCGNCGAKMDEQVS